MLRKKLYVIQRCKIVYGKNLISLKALAKTDNIFTFLTEQERAAANKAKLIIFRISKVREEENEVKTVDTC